MNRRNNFISFFEIIRSGHIVKKALLVSLGIHALIFIALPISKHHYYEKKMNSQDKGIVAMDILKTTKDQVMYSPDPLRFNTQPINSSERKMKPALQKMLSGSRRLRESDAKIDEVIKIAPVKLTESAARSKNFPKVEMMPEIDTSAKPRSTYDIAIPMAVSTPTKIYPAKGTKSTRQVVSGKGQGGLSFADSYGNGGTADGGWGSNTNTLTGTRDREKRNIALEQKFRNGLIEIAQNISQEYNQSKKSGTKKVDVVFLLDASGSMKHVIDIVLKYIDFFINSLKSQKMDYSLGLESFAEQNRKNDITAFGLTLDANAFKGWLGSIVTYGGGDVPEPSLDALMTALENVSFRPESKKIFVLYTDAPPHETDKRGNNFDNVLKTLIKNHVTVHVVSIENHLLKNIANQTYGTWRKIPEDIHLVDEYDRRDLVKFLPNLDPDLEFIKSESNKRMGLPNYDALYMAEIYAYDGDSINKPRKLSDIIFGMVKSLGYKMQDNKELSPANNGNSIAEKGETIKLGIVLKNTVGNIDAENVTARLELEDPVDANYITIISSQSNYGIIPAGKTSARADFKFKISQNFKKNEARFRLKMSGLVYSIRYDLGQDMISIYVKQ